MQLSSLSMSLLATATRAYTSEPVCRPSVSQSCVRVQCVRRGRAVCRPSVSIR